MNLRLIYCSIVMFLFLNNDLSAKNESGKFSDTLVDFISLTAHKGGTFAVAYSPSGNWMASAGLDAAVKIWDAQTSRIIKTLKGHNTEVTAIAISPDAKYLASAGYDKKIILWETGTWKLRKEIELESWSTVIAFDQKGQLAIGLQNGKVKIIEVSTGNSVLAFDTGFGVNCLSFSNDGQTIITGGPVTTWDAASGKRIKEFRLPGGVNGIAIARSSGHFVSVHSRGTAYISDIISGDTIYTYTEKRKSYVPAPTGADEYMVKLPIIACSFSTDGKLLALSCYGNKILIFNTETYSLKYILKGYNSPVTTVGFSQDGKKLTGGTGDGKILIWSLKQ